MTGDSASIKAITETAEADGPGAAGTVAAAGAGTGAEAAAGTGVEAAAGTSVEDAGELLVEEISIDGMCGVY
jgi:mycofactocin precursor